MKILNRFDLSVLLIFFLISLLLFLSTILSCVSSGQSHRSDGVLVSRIDNENALTTVSASLSPTIPLETLRIEQMKMSFWWWSESEVIAMDADNPPPKKRYMDLDRWEYDGEGLTTYPHKVDLLAQIANDGRTNFRGTVKFEMSARFEDYKELTNHDVENGCEGQPWLNQDTVLQENLNIAPERFRNLELKDYDITPFLNQKNAERSICALAFVVQIFNTRGNLVAEKRKTVPVLLGD